MAVPIDEPFDLSPEDVAAAIGVTTDTVRRWTDAGEIRCLRTPSGFRKYRRSDVEAYIERATRTPDEAS